MVFMLTGDNVDGCLEHVEKHFLFICVHSTVWGKGSTPGLVVVALSDSTFVCLEEDAFGQLSGSMWSALKSKLQGPLLAAGSAACSCTHV